MRAMRTAAALLAALMIFAACGRTAKTDYMSWKYKNWEVATDSEKKSCATEYARYTMKQTGQDTGKISEADLEASGKAMTTVVDSILKAQPERTLKQIADDAISEQKAARAAVSAGQ